MPNKILVTGADGFIGASLISYLRERGYYTIACDKQFKKRPEVALISNDIYKLGYQFVGNRGMHDVSVVVHLGASSLLGPSVSNPSAYYQNNVTGTQMLLDDIKAETRRRGAPIPIIFASSAAVYPVDGHAFKTENLAGRSPNPYGATKFACEGMLEAYDGAYLMPAVALRFFNIIGVYGNFSQMLRGPHIIPSIFAAYQDHRPFIINGNDHHLTKDGTCIRDYVNVSVVCDAIERIIKKPKLSGFEAYNIASNSGISNKELIDSINDFLPRKIPVKYGPARPGDPSILIGQSFKFEEEYGKLTHLPIEVTLKEVYNYYKTRGIINDN